MCADIFFIILIFCLSVSSEKVNLECNPSKSKFGCQCDIKIDTLTGFPVFAAVCEYLELQEFPNLVLTDRINYLDLSHNEIQKLQENDAPTEVADTVITLKLCHNNISDIDNTFFDNLRQLKTLDLSYNKLSTLGSDGIFDKLNDLEVLDLSFNKIHIVPDGVFKSLNILRTINLSYNPLHNVLNYPTAIMDKLWINENILELRLDNVGVTRIHAKCWDNFTRLKYLSIADNPLTDIPQTAPTLQYLDLSGTNISDIHETYFNYPNLKVLKMARMKYLPGVPEFALYNLGNLEEFVLTDSDQVRQLNENIFGIMHRNHFPRKLRKFNLARNRMEKLNESFRFILQEMEEFDLSFNPWKCDCNSMWVKEFDFNMKNKNYMRCALPRNTLNKKMLELKPKDTPDCYPEIYGKRSHTTTLLLLIIVIVALLVIIIYLCLYSPSWSIKITSSKMSPDSPYSINNEQI